MIKNKFLFLLFFCLSCNISNKTEKYDLNESVIIYTNADNEVVSIIENTLDKEGFKNQYIIKSFSTNELGGKMLFEGKKIEADLITMSDYYIKEAQSKNKMFQQIQFSIDPIVDVEDYFAPITAQVGSLIINTKMYEKYKINIPSKLEELLKPEYKNLISIPDPRSSSTGWLMLLAIINEYGDGEKGKNLINKIIENAGPHIEKSGTSPLKKVRAGEVMASFGLRHQAIIDKKNGLPIDFVDPIEGNFYIIEAIAVVDKGNKTNKLAMKIAETIVKKARHNLIKYYIIPLYKGETNNNIPKYTKTFPESLNIQKLKEHIEFFHNKY